MADNSMYDKTGYSNLYENIQNTSNYIKNNGNVGGAGTALHEMKKALPDDYRFLDYMSDAIGGKLTPKSNTNNTTTTGNGNGGYVTGQAEVSNPAFDLEAELRRMQAEKQALADAAYKRAVAALNDAYGEAKKSYGEVYNSGVGQLDNSYNNSQGKINRNAEEAFRQAYVNKMLAEKNLSQRLAAQGMSGGASESAMVSLLNNYGNSRNSIQDTLSNNLSDLENTYQGNLSDLYSAYQNQLASLAANRASQLSNLEMQRANSDIAQIGDYMSMLMQNASALNNASKAATRAQAAYKAPESAKATNEFVPVDTMQTNDMGGRETNYGKYDYDDSLDINGKIKAITQLIQDSNVGDYLSKGMLGANLLKALY